MVSQLEDDWPKAGTKKKPSKTAKVAGGIFKAGKADPSEVWQQSRRKRGHVREQYGYKYSRNWPLKGIGREGSLLSRASCRVSGRRNYQDSMTSAKLKGPSRASIAVVPSILHTVLYLDQQWRRKTCGCSVANQITLKSTMSHKNKLMVGLRCLKAGTLDYSSLFKHDMFSALGIYHYRAISNSSNMCSCIRSIFHCTQKSSHCMY